MEEPQASPPAANGAVATIAASDKPRRCAAERAPVAKNVLAARDAKTASAGTADVAADLRREVDALLLREAEVEFPAEDLHPEGFVAPRILPLKAPAIPEADPEVVARVAAAEDVVIAELAAKVAAAGAEAKTKVKPDEDVPPVAVAVRAATDASGSDSNSPAPSADVAVPIAAPVAEPQSAPDAPASAAAAGVAAAEAPEAMEGEMLGPESDAAAGGNARKPRLDLWRWLMRCVAAVLAFTARLLNKPFAWIPDDLRQAAGIAGVLLAAGGIALIVYTKMH